MRRNSIAAAVGLALFAVASALEGEASFDLSVDASLSDEKITPSVAWGMTASGNRLGDERPSLHFDLVADVSRSLVDSDYSGSADLTLSAFRLFGRTNVGLQLETLGYIYASSSDDYMVSALALPVTINGDALSYSIIPKLAIDPADSGYASYGVSNGVSFMVGALLLKPGLELSLIRDWSGGLIYAMKPGIDFAWYPSIPLSVSLAVDYLADSDETTLNSWGLECIGVAAPTESLLLTLTANASIDSSSIRSKLSLESAFTLHRSESGRECSLPVEVGYSDTLDQPVYSLGIGLRYSF